MADTRRTPDKARPGKAPPPRGLADTTEFAHFKSVMRRIIAVPKAELDAMVRASREKSPRLRNPNAPGRKPKRKKR